MCKKILISMILILLTLSANAIDVDRLIKTEQVATNEATHCFYQSKSYSAGSRLKQDDGAVYTCLISKDKNIKSYWDKTGRLAKLD